MQKFNRALTREIEVGGERLAVTLSEQGLLFRVVGSRKPPYEMTWAACLTACTQGRDQSPGDTEVAEAVKALRAGAKERPAAAPSHVAEPPSAPHTPEHPAVEHHGTTHHAAHESTPPPHQSPPGEPTGHHEASHSHHQHQ